MISLLALLLFINKCYYSTAIIIIVLPKLALTLRDSML